MDLEIFFGGDNDPAPPKNYPLEYFLTLSFIWALIAMQVDYIEGDCKERQLCMGGFGSHLSDIS